MHAVHIRIQWMSSMHAVIAQELVQHTCQSPCALMNVIGDEIVSKLDSDSTLCPVVVVGQL